MLAIGARLLGHRVTDVLEGGIGVIYVLDDRLAAKTVQDAFAFDARVTHAFKLEAKFLLQCDHHPNIVEWKSFEHDSGRPFLVMEYVRGGNLRGQLATCQLAPEICAQWAVQVCLAMVHMHDMGAELHQDLKPENILIDGTRIKVADFGLARVAKTVTPPGKVEIQSTSHVSNYVLGVTPRGHPIVGTPSYMAPEQWEGHADERTDLYSFGIVLFEMLTGRFPDRHRERGIGTPSASDESTLSQLLRICHKLSQHDPAKRYRSFKHLFVDLEPITRGSAGEYEIVGRPEFHSVPFAQQIDQPSFMSLPYSRFTPLKRLVELYALGEFEAALEILEKAEDVHGEHSWMRIEKAWVQVRLGGYTAARELSEPLLSAGDRATRALEILALAHAGEGRIDAARVAFDEAKAASDKRLDEYRYLGEIVNRLFLNRERAGLLHAEAVAGLWQQLSREMGDDVELARALGTHALLVAHLGDKARALSLHADEERLLRLHDSAYNLIPCLFNQAELLRLSDRLEDARAKLEEAERLLTKWPDPERRMLVLGLKAEVLRSEGRTGDAAHLHEEEGWVAEDLSDDRALTRAVSLEVQVLARQYDECVERGALEEADRIGVALIAKLRRLSARTSLLEALMEHAKLFQMLPAVLRTEARVRAMREELEAAAEITVVQESEAQRSGDWTAVREALRLRTRILQITAQNASDWSEKAKALTNKAALCRRIGDDNLLSATLGDLGITLRELGRLDEAASLHEEEEELARSAQDQEGLAYSCLNQSILLRKMGRATAAHNKILEALQLFGDLGNEKMVTECIRVLMVMPS